MTTIHEVMQSSIGLVFKYLTVMSDFSLQNFQESAILEESSRLMPRVPQSYIVKL